MTRALTLAVVVLAFLSWAAPSSAEQSHDRARDLFNIGIDAFEGEDYDAALDAFELSYQLNPVTSVLYNIAMCHRALVRYVESVRFFERYLDEGGERVAVERRREVEGLIREMDRLVGRLQVDVAPPEAEIEIDGVPLDRTTIVSPRVRAGSHTLRITCPGYSPQVRQVEVAPGEVSRIEVVLVREAQQTGHPQVGGEPRRPWYRRWWVWTLVGVAVATGVGVGLGVGLSGGDDLEGGDWGVSLP